MQVQGNPGLHREFYDSQSSKVGPCLNKKERKRGGGREGEREEDWCLHVCSFAR